MAGSKRLDFMLHIIIYYNLRKEVCHLQIPTFLLEESVFSILYW